MNLLHRIINYLTTKERKLIMTLFERIEALEAKTPAPIDTSNLATKDEVAAVDTKVTELAALVGTPTAPAA
jgi:hypothetical protein